MINNWLKYFPLKKKRVSSVAQEEKEILTEFILFLWKEIDIPLNAQKLKSQKESFFQLSQSKKEKVLPKLYLQFEQYLTEKNIVQRYTSSQLRKLVQQKYSEILNRESMKIICSDLNLQELLLSNSFLRSVLNKANKILGDFSNPDIKEISDYLQNVDYITSSFVKERKRLLEFSSEIFSILESSLGKNAITNLYLVVYKDYFDTYHLLDSFTSILNVIPEEMTAEDLVNFPSKQQMLKMLQKQLFSLEETNERLTKEILERKKIEKQLSSSEHIKTRILETAMDGIILVDQNGIVLDWNKEAERIVETSKEETLGKSIYSFVPKSLKEELKESFEDFLKTGEGKLINKRVETIVKRKNGTIVDIELTIISIVNKDEVLFNAFFRDITNRKAIINEIKEAKVTAEKSAKAKSTFLSNMSHEIRTPLNVIIGLAGLLQKSNFSKPKEDLKNVEGIQFSAQNLLVLINDILDFSKIEAGKLDLHKTDFNIVELIDNVSRGFKIKADEKGIHYKTNIDSQLPRFVIGDQYRLNQILTNLIGNALKFTKKGTVELTVKIGHFTESHINLSFLVTDTGIGIPKEKVDRIFNSFYQIHEPGKEKNEGTGLGLSISKQLIELQGGYLNVESSLDKGSSFGFDLNFRRSNLTLKDEQKLVETDQKEIQRLSELRILVVEDNKMNQFFIKQLLSNWDTVPDVAENGVQALKFLEKQVYDVILMDMHMPVMDGPETALSIRNSTNEKLRNIPIVACSADVFPEAKKLAFDSGMNFYITKPINEKSLKEILHNLPLFKLKSSFEAKKEIAVYSEKAAQKDLPQFCNFEFLCSTFEGDADTILSVLQLFKNETPIDIENLSNASKKQDFKQVKHFAHKLKSSYRTLGIESGSHQLQMIENLSKEEDIASIATHLQKLEESYPEILKEITQEIARYAK